MTYDVIVIGVGGMGSATVYHLARRGKKVLGLEQFDIPHDRGSSHGINRIIRLAYAEDPNYVPLLRRAYELWREIEYVANERLLFITGGIDAGTRDSRTVTGSLRSCEIHNISHEQMDAPSLRRRFPGYQLPEDMVAVYQPDAGFVLSEGAIVAYVMAAQALGAGVQGRERVLEWKADGPGVWVRTDRDTYRASKLVVTAGPWTADIVPALAPLLVPERQVLMWTQPLHPEYFRLEVFPVFNMETPEGRFYGFPIHGVPGFKLGRYHHLYQRADPHRMDRECHPEDEQVLRDAIRRYFPDANGPTMALKTCLFTNTRDEHFVIDHHPEFPQVCIAAGFSGHGFKFCSVIGEIMADLALESYTRWDIGLFRLNRLLN
ncbi:MAG: N-methyl-L-tryptophan oxidase [candidate division NC10 bacterium]|jgi:sarcosine oxidase|nr:N-methyl-L-tryptophan oxidase [candidate division NC10 bacterium]MCZ6551185.1 N-methyl-L-tryptophan oxidase [candidate division NC10 bacterium]